MMKILHQIKISIKIYVNFLRRLGSWLSHFLSIIDSIFGIITFTFWSPGLSTLFLFWWTRMLIKYQIDYYEI